MNDQTKTYKIEQKLITDFNDWLDFHEIDFIDPNTFEKTKTFPKRKVYSCESDVHAVRYLSAVLAGYISVPACKLSDGRAITVGKTFYVTDLEAFKNQLILSDKEYYLYTCVYCNWVDYGHDLVKQYEKPIVSSYWAIRLGVVAS